MPRGRPSKLETISLKQVEKLAGYALTDTEIADVIDVCEKTLNNYKSNPDFLQSLKKGRSKADNYVIGSLFHRAIGYTHPEVQLFCYKGKVVKTNVMKHYPPDTTAAIFWLKNRKPEDWRDKTAPIIDQSQHIHLTTIKEVIEYAAKNRFESGNNRLGSVAMEK